MCERILCVVFCCCCCCCRFCAFDIDKDGFRLKFTWAAMMRCRSTTSWQFGHTHSLQRHSFLWPFKQEITPWLRQRAHFGVRRKRFAFCESDGKTSSGLILINSSSKDISFFFWVYVFLFLCFFSLFVCFFFRLNSPESGEAHGNYFSDECKEKLFCVIFFWRHYFVKLITRLNRYATIQKKSRSTMHLPINEIYN